MVFRRKKKSGDEEPSSSRERRRGEVIDNNPDYDPSVVKSGACFIATAVYNTPMAEEIQILRRYRDAFLLRNNIGRTFVATYYKLSPPVARFLSQHASLASMVRVSILTPVIKVISLFPK